MLQDTHHDLRTPTALNLREAHFESTSVQNKGSNRGLNMYMFGHEANSAEKASVFCRERVLFIVAVAQYSLYTSCNSLKLQTEA